MRVNSISVQGGFEKAVGVKQSDISAVFRGKDYKRTHQRV